MDQVRTVDGTASLDAFYRAERSRVLALAYVLTGDRGAAEELTHDAFADLVPQWERVAAYDDPGAWVRRAVTNRATSRWRRRGVERRIAPLLDVDAGRSDAPPPSEDTEVIWAAVRALPAMQARSVALHYLDDWPVERIAAVLGCAPATVKVHLHRARRTLAERLGADLADHETDQEGATS